MNTKNIAEALMLAALKNKELLSEIKTLMVKHGMYKEARAIKDLEERKEIEVDSDELVTEDVSSVYDPIRTMIYNPNKPDGSRVFSGLTGTSISLGVGRCTPKISREYEFIGSGHRFYAGDKVKIKDGYSFGIETLLESGEISADIAYTVKEYVSYGLGDNWFTVEEMKYSLPNCGVERV